jgi:hypothetical protein
MCLPSVGDYLLVNVQSDVVKYGHGNRLVVFSRASPSRPSRLPHATILNHLELSFKTDYLCNQTDLTFMKYEQLIQFTCPFFNPDNYQASWPTAMKWPATTIATREVSR